MKKLIGGLAILVSLFILGGCGGTPEEKIIGTWKINIRSVDITLGDVFPADAKMIVKGYSFALLMQAPSANKISFEFKKNGDFIVAAAGDKVKGKWSIKGKRLKLYTSVEGQKAEVVLHIKEIESDEMTISLSAQMLLDQLKSLLPKTLQLMVSNHEVTELVKGTSIKATFKKE